MTLPSLFKYSNCKITCMKITKIMLIKKFSYYRRITNYVNKFSDIYKATRPIFYAFLLLKKRSRKEAKKQKETKERGNAQKNAETRKVFLLFFLFRLLGLLETSCFYYFDLAFVCCFCFTSIFLLFFSSLL